MAFHDQSVPLVQGVFASLETDLKLRMPGVFELSTSEALGTNRMLCCV